MLDGLKITIAGVPMVCWR